MHGDVTHYNVCTFDSSHPYKSEMKRDPIKWVNAMLLGEWHHKNSLEKHFDSEL